MLKFNALMLFIIIISIILGATVRSQTTIGSGLGPVFYDDVQCTGSELTLHDCPKAPLEENSCSHSNDVGVTCVPGNHVIMDENLGG